MQALNCQSQRNGSPARDSAYASSLLFSFCPDPTPGPCLPAIVLASRGEAESEARSSFSISSSIRLLGPGRFGGAQADVKADTLGMSTKWLRLPAAVFRAVTPRRYLHSSYELRLEATATSRTAVTFASLRRERHSHRLTRNERVRCRYGFGAPFVPGCLKGNVTLAQGKSA